MPSLHALVVLAWALIRTLLARLVGGESGLLRFHRNYDADRLPAVTSAERAAMPSMQGCIACGLCDLDGATVRGAGPMDLALASARTTVDADAASLGLAALSDEVLAAREKICPTRVPLVAIGRLTRARAAAVADTPTAAGR
ncbi:MAG: hypothetical protein NVSMB47_15120 [Polyangiales bacterium]